MIKKVAFISHPTTDMEKNREFYGEILGLSHSTSYGDCWSEYGTPDGATIALDTFSTKFSDSPSPYVAFETDDIEAEVTRLRGKGVTILKEPWLNEDDGQEICRMAIIQDPCGNAIMLHQIAPSRA